MINRGTSDLSQTRLSDRPGDVAEDVGPDVAHAFSVLCRAFEPDIFESIVNLSLGHPLAKCRVVTVFPRTPVFGRESDEPRRHRWRPFSACPTTLKDDRTSASPALDLALLIQP